MFRLHTACRACGNETLIPVLDLGHQPPANSFRSMTEEHDGFAPLSVLYCERCRLGQLSVVVDPKILYSGYPYVTSPGKTMRDHIKTIYQDIRREQGNALNDMGKVFEIGSNDGTLLSQFREHGAVDVVGMEPAQNLSDLANAKGIRTINKFFCKDTIVHTAGLIGVPDVILARHVFCHVDDWHDFIDALELISKKDTLVCIEVPYAADTISRREFDQCYHEHLSYLSIHSIEALLENSEFHLHKVVRYPIHGGSIILMLRRNDWEGDLDPSIAEFLDSEETSITADTWTDLAVHSSNNMDHLYCVLEDMHHLGKTVAGFGASAKSTVWINASRIGRFLSFIADETPQKQGKFSPGSEIPILPESELVKRNPDFVLLFAWNFKDEVMAKYPQFKGRWLVPVPTVEVC